MGKSINCQVYNRLKDDILFLNLEPGTAVSVQKLADLYGTSRTPVREAIVRMQQEGLVEIIPQVRTNISLFNIDRVREEQFVRHSLEVQVVEGLVKNCTPLVLDTLENIIAIERRACQRQNVPEAFELDTRFHRTIFEAAGHTMACDLVEASNTHSDRLRYLSMSRHDAVPKVTALYDRIVEAARRRDGETICDLLRQHLSNWHHEIETLRRMYPAYFMQKD